MESLTGTVMDRLYALWLELQLSALASDWADAVSLAAAGSSKAVGQARRAARALQRYGEPYTAARLLVDLLPFLDRRLRATLAKDAAKQLYALGAGTSASKAAATLKQPAQ